MKKKKYKLLLINPLSSRHGGLAGDKNSIYPPISLGIIAALTPDYWDIEILDENFEQFKYKQADLVGITALTSQATRAYEIAGIYKNKNISTVIGGIHASMMPDEALAYTNTVVIGEAESIWADIIVDFENNSIKQIYNGELKPMVHSPLPRIDLYHPGYAFGSIQTTRGCPMSCDFCSVHTFNGKKYRQRPVKDVVDEFERIPQDKVCIVDDNFIGYSKQSAERMVDICKEIIKRGIKKDWLCAASMNIAEYDDVLKYAAEAGCRLIFLGIESELVDQLESANKKLNVKIGVDNFSKVYDKIHKYGIAILGAFIYGLDTDTPKTIENRTKYILNSSVDAIQASILTPMPGTPLFNRMQQDNRLIHNNFPFDWDRYDYTEAVFKPKLMTAAILTKSVSNAWETLYELKNMKRKFLNALKSTKNPVSASWSYNSNIQYHNMLFEHKKDKAELNIGL